MINLTLWAGNRHLDWSNYSNLARRETWSKRGEGGVDWQEGLKPGGREICFQMEMSLSNAFIWLPYALSTPSLSQSIGNGLMCVTVEYSVRLPSVFQLYESTCVECNILHFFSIEIKSRILRNKFTKNSNSSLSIYIVIQSLKDTI